MIFDTSQRLGSHVWCGVVWDLIVERWHTIISDPSTQRYSWFQKKTGIEHFPNVNLVLFICQCCLFDNTYQIIFKNVIEF
jgi:hypothetical protein